MSEKIEKNNDGEEPDKKEDANSEEIASQEDKKPVITEAFKDIIQITPNLYPLDSVFKLYNILFGLEESDDVQPFWKSQKNKKRNVENEKIKVVKELINSGIDPSGFDILISNELDRRLKEKYGNRFLWLTVAFTIISYGVVIFNAIFDWGITDIAITALIIEIPLQFIGLLYIIARNLFPRSDGNNDSINKVDFGKFRNTLQITNKE